MLLAIKISLFVKKMNVLTEAWGTEGGWGMFTKVFFHQTSTNLDSTFIQVFLSQVFSPFDKFANQQSLSEQYIL